MNARSLFYPDGKKFSKAEERMYAREDLIFNVTEDLQIALENRGISRAELARRLGKSKSFVSQVLSGARNMTLGSFSDICFALGIEPKVTVLPESELLHESCKAPVHDMSTRTSNSKIHVFFTNEQSIDAPYQQVQWSKKIG